MLLNQRGHPLAFAHISLLLVGLMWVFPFLDYYHAYPITTFYQEWGAAVLGLAAMPLLATNSYWRQSEVPRIILLPIIMIVVVVVQLVFDRIPYFGQALLVSLYLVWAALLIMLGARLRELLGLAKISVVLAIFLLAGAELNAAIGIYQHFQWHSFLDPVISRKISAAVFGNIAQPNHYADYLGLGLVSLGLLYTCGTLRPWHVLLLSLPILFVLPLTGSREVWLYLLWLVLASFIWQRNNASVRPLLKYSLVILLGFGLMQLLIHLPWLAGSPGSSTSSMQRMFAANVHSGSIRLFLWHEAWLIFTQFPFLGAGFGQFAWQHFQLLPTLHNVQISGLYTNAHNLVMQLAAETGIFGLLLFFGTLLPWLRQVYRAERTIHQWWGLSALGILAIHSMLEYPLWYTYFIGIAAPLLGMLDISRYRLGLRNVWRTSVVFTMLMGVLWMWQLMAGYRVFENLIALRSQSGSAAAYASYYEDVYKHLAKMGHQILLQPYADLYSCPLIKVNQDHIADKLEFNARAMHFIPVDKVVYLQALLLAQNGETKPAQLQMERAIWSYPEEFANTERKLRDLVHKDPAHFSALLEFALRKNEEYQRELNAVSAK